MHTPGSIHTIHMRVQTISAIGIQALMTQYFQQCLKQTLTGEKNLFMTLWPHWHMTSPAV